MNKLKRTLIQELYKHDPWKMLVCCIFLNQTTRTQVDQIRDEFFNKYPTAETAARADEKEIADVIRCLGFYNKRAKTIIKFSKQWITKKWSRVDELHGIGRYAYDSWKIFQEGRLDIPVEDKKLKIYLSQKNLQF